MKMSHIHFLSRRSQQRQTQPMSFMLMRKREIVFEEPKLILPAIQDIAIPQNEGNVHLEIHGVAAELQNPEPEPVVESEANPENL